MDRSHFELLIKTNQNKSSQKITKIKKTAAHKDLDKYPVSATALHECHFHEAHPCVKPKYGASPKS